MKLYRFHVDFGRMGDLRGLFAVDGRGDKILHAMCKIGLLVQFGEVLGKHSDVDNQMDEDDLAEVEATPEEVEIVCRVLGAKVHEPGYATISGYNPFDYIEWTDLDDEDADEILNAAGVKRWWTTEDDGE